MVHNAYKVALSFTFGPVPRSWRLDLLMGRIVAHFGNLYGTSTFQIRLKALHGVQAVIYFQPKPSSVIGKS